MGITSDKFGGIESIGSYVFYMFLSNLVIGPLFTLFPLSYLARLLSQRQHLTRLREGRLFEFTQKEVNIMYEPPDAVIEVRYCNLIRSFLVACFLFDVCPLVMPLCFCYMVLQFWIDKYLLLRRTKRMRRFHADFAIDLAENAELGILLMAVGRAIFKYKATREVDYFDLFLIAVALLILMWSLQTVAEKEFEKSGNNSDLDFGFCDRQIPR